MSLLPLRSWRSRVKHSLSRVLSSDRRTHNPGPRASLGLVNNYRGSTMCTQNKFDEEEFFRYSSGRWLWNEDEQRQARYRKFNVEELKSVAAASVDAKSCVSIAKIAEGGFNKVFRLVMDNGSVVIARIPNPNAGPPSKTTASEVATMDFVASVLGIPVPKVFSWSADPSNKVGTEYILMEEATGTRLDELWDDMELSEKLKIVDEIVAVEKKLSSVSFKWYGSLYFAADAFPGCQRAESTRDMQELKDVENRFVVGPVTDREFWSGQRANMAISRGPWKNCNEYLAAIAHREIAWISEHAASTPSNSILGSSNAQSSPEAHIELYRKFTAVSPYLSPSRQALSRSTVWHWDVHAPNIFVTDNKITCLIDWQDAWLGPLFLQAKHPRLVDYNGPFMLEFPDHYKSLEDADERAQIQKQVEKSIVLWTYEIETKDANPDLHDIFHLPQGRTRRETVQFAADTWGGDIIPFRQCLIRIQRHWNEYSTETPCPINFSEEELEQHVRDGEGWNERAEFWDSLEGIVHRDGWTSAETYEQAFEIFAQLREAGLKNLKGEELDEFERETRWAAREKE